MGLPEPYPFLHNVQRVGSKQPQQQSLNRGTKRTAMASATPLREYCKADLKPKLNRRHFFPLVPIAIFLFLSSFEAPHLYHLIAPSTLSLRPSWLALSSLLRPREHVAIWSPQGHCFGQFASQPAEGSPDAFPYAIIREAVLDRRFASRQQYRQISGSTSRPFERLILFVTAHLSVSLSDENARVSLMLQNGGVLEAVPGFRVQIDDIQQVYSYSTLPGKYVPGKKTRNGKEVYEWQITVSLTEDVDHGLDDASFSEMLRSLADRDSSVLSLSVPLLRFDGKRINFEPTVALGCVVGWDNTAGFEALSRLQAGPSCGQGAENAIIFSGSALYGKKKRDRQSYQELAHFAARALTGPVRFDAVAVSVMVDNTYSESYSNCDTDLTCLRMYQQRNEDLMRKVADAIEEELEILMVPRRMFGNIYLLPLCRLGSHSTGSEQGDPCSASMWYGQVHALFSPYALLSSYFKWSASLDIDEFLMKNSGNAGATVAFQPASALLDKASARGQGSPSGMIFTWLNFRLENQHSLRPFTEQIQSGVTPMLRNQDNETSEICYEFPKGKRIGKPAVRCKTGLGYTIHQPIIMRNGTGLKHHIVSGNPAHDIRTWHARLFVSNRGRCEYVDINAKPEHTTASQLK